MSTLGDATGPVRSDLHGVPTADHAPVAPLALVGQPGSSSADDIAALMRQRMRVLALVAAPLLLVVFIGTGLGLPPFGEANWKVATIFAVLVAMTLVAGALVWRRRPMSLGQLRALEVAILAISATCIILHILDDNLWSPPHRGDASVFSALSRNKVTVPILSARGDNNNLYNVQLSGRAMAYFGGYYNLFWYLLIFGYGLFIPNSLRRAIVVIVILASLPLLTNLILIWQDAAVRAGRPWDLLGQAAGWMTAAAAAAIFGSYRIESLRREAAQARKLGQYQLKQKLGEGGMGEVYLAEHMLLRRPCAIKLIRPERAGDPKNLARFEREVRATATLTNWHTVEIFDYGRAADGAFYYVMEYLPGLTLDQLVKQHGPIPPERALHLLRQMCAALREAHAIGLIHRDIKPGNIIVGQRGGRHDVAKLLDFGLVHAHGPQGDWTKLTQEGMFAGTPAYMSPEQAAGLEAVDARSDMYSLGAVAFFLLTGQPPFVKQTALQVAAAHMHEPPPPLAALCPTCPPELEAVIARCLAKDPAQRFPDADSLDQALQSCPAANDWTEARAATWWRRLSPTNPSQA